MLFHFGPVEEEGTRRFVRVEGSVYRPPQVERKLDSAPILTRLTPYFAGGHLPLQMSIQFLFNKER